MRASFVVSEIAVALRRNLIMAVGVVLTVGLSLGIFGGALLLGDMAHTLNRHYYGKLEVAVFLKKDVTEQQRTSLESALRADPRVRDVRYVSQAEAYQRFKEDFKAQPELVKAASPDTLPESFRVQLRDPKQFAIIQSEFAGAPGVDVINDQRQLLKKLFGVLDGVNVTGVALAVIAGIAALVQTFNTIRLAAFSRRREIGIMRLVGASNFTIQLPFVLEGAIAGLVGGVVACLFTVAFKSFGLDGALVDLFSSGAIPNVTWSQVLQTLPWVLVLGTALSALASYLTSLLYVRV